MAAQRLKEQSEALQKNDLVGVNPLAQSHDLDSAANEIGDRKQNCWQGPDICIHVGIKPLIAAIRVRAARTLAARCSPPGCRHPRRNVFTRERHRLDGPDHNGSVHRRSCKSDGARLKIRSKSVPPSVSVAKGSILFGLGRHATHRSIWIIGSNSPRRIPETLQVNLFNLFVARLNVATRIWV